MHAALWHASGSVLARRGFKSAEGNSSLLPLQVDEGEDDDDPVEYVGEDTAERRGIVPTENSIEDLSFGSRELNAILGWKVVTYLPSTVGSRGAGLSNLSVLAAKGVSLCYVPLGCHRSSARRCRRSCRILDHHQSRRHHLRHPWQRCSTRSIRHPSRRVRRRSRRGRWSSRPGTSGGWW